MIDASLISTVSTTPVSLLISQSLFFYGHLRCQPAPLPIHRIQIIGCRKFFTFSISPQCLPVNRKGGIPFVIHDFPDPFHEFSATVPHRSLTGDGYCCGWEAMPFFNGRYSLNSSIMLFTPFQAPAYGRPPAGNRPPGIPALPAWSCFVSCAHWVRHRPHIFHKRLCPESVFSTWKGPLPFFPNKLFCSGLILCRLFFSNVQQGKCFQHHAVPAAPLRVLYT